MSRIFPSKAETPAESCGVRPQLLLAGLVIRSGIREILGPDTEGCCMSIELIKGKST